MGEYTSAQMRAEAHRHGDHVADMLNDCATLREQIELAREGVTDEVVNTAEKARKEKRRELHARSDWKPYYDSDDESMRAALQAVAHLLPSDRRNYVAELISAQEMVKKLQGQVDALQTLISIKDRRTSAQAAQVAAPQPAESNGENGK
jgi:hypothetical protein